MSKLVHPDVRIDALERRVKVLEKQNAALQAAHKLQAQRLAALSQLISRLQPRN